MPDYNGKATVFWWTMVTLGAAVIGLGLTNLLAEPWPVRLQILVGIVAAMLAGIFPVRIPNSKNSFAAGEIFIFLLLLLQGPTAAALAAACETALGAWRAESVTNNRRREVRVHQRVCAEGLQLLQQR